MAVHVGVRGPGHLSRTYASYSPEALAAFDAMTTPPSPALKALYNTAITDLQLAGIWTKLDALYLMNVETAQAARVNIKNPGTYNLTATSSPTFTAKVGYAGDGAAAFLNTNFNPTTAVAPNYVQNSASGFAWGLKQGQDANGVLGQNAAATANVLIQPRFTDDRVYGRISDSADFSAANADGRGLFQVNRTASNARELFKNGASVATSATVSASPANATVTILRMSSGLYSGGAAMAGLGSALSAGEAASLYTILNAFKTGVDALP